MLALLIGLTALAPQSITAQDAPPALIGASSEADDKVHNPIIAGPPDRTPDALSGSTIALDIDEKKSELSLSYGWAGQTTREENGGVRLARTAYQIGLKLPIGGSDNLIDRATVDGLADGATLSASWNWFGTRSQDNFNSTGFRRLLARASAACSAMSDNKDDCNPKYPTTRFLKTYLPEREVNQVMLNPGYAAGIEGSVGLNNYDYRTRGTLAKNSGTKPQFSIKAYFSYIPSDAMQMITASVEYQNVFKALDDEILCPAVVTDPNKDCVKAAPGAPGHADNLLLALDYRRVLATVRGLGEFATSPKGTYDALNDVFEAELPIYLKIANSPVQPGVKATYSSKDRAVTVGVFLKSSFGF